MIYSASWLRCLFVGLLLLFSIGLAACSSVSTGDPPVADSTFSALLVDLHLTAARAQHRETLRPSLRDSVFAHHGVRRSDFEATLKYYSNRPDSFKSLYNSVLDTLGAIEGTLRNRGPSYNDRPPEPRHRGRLPTSDPR